MVSKDQEGTAVKRVLQSRGYSNFNSSSENLNN